MICTRLAINGQETRSWLSDTRFKSELASINRIPAKAEIRLTVNSQTAKSVQVTTGIKTAEAGPLVYYLVLQENNLQSTVNVVKTVASCCVMIMSCASG